MIPESQLETWAKQGSITQSSNTYAAIKAVLEASDAPYASRPHKSFLQGSYANDTNVYADSDVDVVMRLDSVFYPALDNLSDDDKAAYEAARQDAVYGFPEFKADVIAQLSKPANFGKDVDPGNKAIFIKGNGTRRDADVVVCTLYRKFTRFKSWNDYRSIDGIRFVAGDGAEIINYPTHHSNNCTTKHQDTKDWFKPCVRILKNMRTRMVADGWIKDGLAPSYFLEGMLYNVPNKTFGGTYQSSVAGAMNWLINCDRSKLLCANEQYYLLHPSSPVTWRGEKCNEFLAAATDFWQQW